MSGRPAARRLVRAHRLRRAACHRPVEALAGRRGGGCHDNERHEHEERGFPHTKHGARRREGPPYGGPSPPNESVPSSAGRRCSGGPSELARCRAGTHPMCRCSTSSRTRSDVHHRCRNACGSRNAENSPDAEIDIDVQAPDPACKNSRFRRLDPPEGRTRNSDAIRPRSQTDAVTPVHGRCHPRLLPPCSGERHHDSGRRMHARQSRHADGLCRCDQDKARRPAGRRRSAGRAKRSGQETRNGGENSSRIGAKARDRGIVPPKWRG